MHNQLAIGEIAHMRCGAHTLSLAVNHYLDRFERKARIYELVSEHGLHRYCPTRWVTTARTTAECVPYDPTYFTVPARSVKMVSDSVARIDGEKVTLKDLTHEVNEL